MYLRGTGRRRAGWEGDKTRREDRGRIVDLRSSVSHTGTGLG